MYAAFKKDHLEVWSITFGNQVWIVDVCAVFFTLTNFHLHLSSNPFRLRCRSEEIIWEVRIKNGMDLKSVTSVNYMLDLKFCCTTEIFSWNSSWEKWTSTLAKGVLSVHTQQNKTQVLSHVYREFMFAIKPLRWNSLSN